MECSAPFTQTAPGKYCCTNYMKLFFHFFAIDDELAFFISNNLKLQISMPALNEHNDWMHELRRYQKSLAQNKRSNIFLSRFCLLFAHESLESIHYIESTLLIYLYNFFCYHFVENPYICFQLGAFLLHGLIQNAPQQAEVVRSQRTGNEWKIYRHCL